MTPGRAAYAVLGGWLALAGLAVAWESLRTPWAGAAAGLLLIAWTDLRAVTGRGAPTVSRTLPASLPIGVWSDVILRLANPARRATRITVFDHHPAAAETSGLPCTVRVPAGGEVTVRYRLRPLRRGEASFAPSELLVDSPLGLWQRRVRTGGSASVRVYPNYAEVAKHALLATHDRLSQMGIHRRHRRGEGLEFHQLREYRDGDSLRQIAWKATARMGKLISHEYQDERDQQIMLLVDCGRRMLAHDGELSHFDHALNSVLLLAHVALRQGDLVGFMTFGGVSRMLLPHRGPRTLSTMLGALHDLQPTIHGADYLSAATEVAARLRKRSLVVMVTNLRDEDDEEILPALRLLRRRHLVLVASLRERVLDEALDAEIAELDDALTVAATHRYLNARRRAHEAIRRSGVLTLDVQPERLPVAVVNRYLEVKRSGML